MKDFFFDTANLKFIKETSEKLEGKIDFKLIRGVTTNPNAFNKIDEPSLFKWVEIAEEIGNFIFDLRQDNKGEIHIQLPNSTLNIDKAIKFANYISELPKDKMTIGMKIPPYVELLKNVDAINDIVLTNVTGISDHATAMKCISYGVNYVSIIPGRMEEVGIPAKELMSYLFQSNHGNTKIISGSMRTLEQLEYTFQLNTVPTIGERVWPLIFEDNNLKNLLNIDYEVEFKISELSPKITDRSIELSSDFFVQMDELGKTATHDLNQI